jgi:hypothetical protein
MDRLEATVHRHLESYLAGNISLAEFTDWLVGTTWNIEQAADPEAVQLAYAIELALAEHSSGLLSLDELRDELRTISQHVNLQIG